MADRSPDLPIRLLPMAGENAVVDGHFPGEAGLSNGDGRTESPLAKPVAAGRVADPIGQLDPGTGLVGEAYIRDPMSKARPRPSGGWGRHV